MELDALIRQITDEVSVKVKTAVPQAPIAAPDIDLASTLEYSMLNPDTTRMQILEALAATKRLRLANICVAPYYASLAAEYLYNTGIAVCVPVGFPHGAASTVAKAEEIREAIKNGATELDVALNVLAVKSGRYDDMKRDLDEMCGLTRGRAKLKAIFEQSLYSEEEKVNTLRIADACGVDFIKISNALTGKSACAGDVRFVRGIISKDVGIKIDGGVRSPQIAWALIAAGANRFGVSQPEKVLGK